MSEKLTRRDTREAVFLLLFQNELTGEPVEEAADACKEAYEMAVNGEILKTAAAVTEKYGEFDEIIENTARSVRFPVFLLLTRLFLDLLCMKCFTAPQYLQGLR